MVIDIFNPNFTPLYFLSNKMPISFEFLGLSWENMVACDFAYYTGNVEACFCNTCKRVLGVDTPGVGVAKKTRVRPRRWESRGCLTGIVVCATVSWGEAGIVKTGSLCSPHEGWGGCSQRYCTWLWIEWGGGTSKEGP